MIRNTEIVLVAYCKTESCFIFFFFFFLLLRTLCKKQTNKQKFLYWLKKNRTFIVISLFICYFDVNMNGCGGGLYLLNIFYPKYFGNMSSGPVGSLCQAQFWPLDLMFDTHNEDIT